MICAAHKRVGSPVSRLRRQLAQNVTCWVGNAMHHARRVRTTREEQPDRFRIPCVHNQRSRVTRVAETVAADRQLIREQFGDIGFGLRAIAEIVHGNIEVDCRHRSARQARGPSALGHSHLQNWRLAFTPCRRNARRSRRQSTVRLARSQFENVSIRVERP